MLLVKSRLSPEKDLILPKWAEQDLVLSLPTPPDLQIIIEEAELCWRYAGLVVEEVHIAPLSGVDAAPTESSWSSTHQ